GRCVAPIPEVERLADLAQAQAGQRRVRRRYRSRRHEDPILERGVRLREALYEEMLVHAGLRVGKNQIVGPGAQKLECVLRVARHFDGMTIASEQRLD